MLEHFKLEMDYSCDFCKGEKETIFIIFVHCKHKYFVLRWCYLNAMQLSGFDVIMYFGDHGFDKDKAYFIQLLILMGKFHIHKMKCSGSKPNFYHFRNDFKLYFKVLCYYTSKKAIRTHNIVSRYVV